MISVFVLFIVGSNLILKIKVFFVVLQLIRIPDEEIQQYMVVA